MADREPLDVDPAGPCIGEPLDAIRREDEVEVERAVLQLIEVLASHDLGRLRATEIETEHRTLEVLKLENGRWTILATHAGDEVVRAGPFEAIELQLAALFLPLPRQRPVVILDEFLVRGWSVV